MQFIRKYKNKIVLACITILTGLVSGVGVLYFQHKKGIELIDQFFDALPSYALYILVCLFLLAGLTELYLGYFSEKKQPNLYTKTN